jgi:hypothetical protein
LRDVPQKERIMQTDIFAEGAVTRILDGELEHVRRRDGVIAHSRVLGFRLEDPAAMRLNGSAIVEGSRTEPDKHGVYASRVTMRGVARKQCRSTFFPVCWTAEKVLSAIEEAYLKRTAINGNLKACLGFGDGVQIQLKLDDAGLVTDAYPVMRSPKKKQAECKLCGREKIRVCPLGHSTNLKPRWKMPENLRWFRRWLKWKLHNLV